MRTNFDKLLSRHVDGGLSGTTLGVILANLPLVSTNGPWIAGGAIRRTLLGEPLAESDIDFFFKNRLQYEKFVTAMCHINARIIANREHNVTWLAYFDRSKDDRLPSTIKVQAITIDVYDTPEVLIDSFDFTICQFAYDGQDLICGEYALWDLGRKRIVPHRISYGTATLRRLIKYTKQGFFACSGGLANILQQVVATPDIIRAETEYID